MLYSWTWTSLRPPLPWWFYPNNNLVLCSAVFALVFAENSSTVSIFFFIIVVKTFVQVYSNFFLSKSNFLIVNLAIVVIVNNLYIYTYFAFIRKTGFTFRTLKSGLCNRISFFSLSVGFWPITLKLSVRIQQELVPISRENRHSTVNIKVAVNGQTRPNFPTKIAITLRRFYVFVWNFGRVLPVAIAMFWQILVWIGFILKELWQFLSFLPQRKTQKLR